MLVFLSFVLGSEDGCIPTFWLLLYSLQAPVAGPPPLWAVARKRLRRRFRHWRQQTCTRARLLSCMPFVVFLLRCRFFGFWGWYSTTIQPKKYILYPQGPLNSLDPEPWEDPCYSSTLGFYNLRHRSIRVQKSGVPCFGSSQGSGEKRLCRPCERLPVTGPSSGQPRQSSSPGVSMLVHMGRLFWLLEGLL